MILSSGWVINNVIYKNITMNIQNVMKDPRFQNLMYQIESHIHEFDESMKSEDTAIKDTNVKSVIRKVMGIVKGNGKSPTFSEANEVDRAMKALSLSLVALRDAYDSGAADDQKMSKKDWLLLLKAVENTLKTRREMAGHPRGYLDFLKGFLESGSL
jgi:hypothetical protein